MANKIRQIHDQSVGSVEIAQLEDLLGPPPLLPNESHADYEGLKARLRAKISPQDMLEEIWVRDILDLQWEVLRMRRIKARILSSSSPEGLESLLYRRVPYHAKDKLVEGWGRADKETIKEVGLVLKQRGLSLDDIDAHSLLKLLKPLEAIDRMISQAEARRNNALREIEKSREAAARRLRAALSDEDGLLTSADGEGSAP
jgi:hypothetical protein